MIENAMTLTIKDSIELDSLAKPGAPSQNTENKAGQSPRCNPVCLEVGVTIRSLPAETGGPTQPMREEGRTVIVFDNGAVLRSSIHLPIGQTVIVSNANGRDVVCRVVGGRNLPNLKGYIEVEFIEPVNDFWHIHQDAEPVSVPAPPAPALAPQHPQMEPTTPPPAAPRASVYVADPAKLESQSSGSGPTFEDIAGLVSMSPPAGAREKQVESAARNAELGVKDDLAVRLAETAKPATPASPRLSLPEQSREKPAALAAQEIPPMPARPTSPLGGFLGKGLLAATPTPVTSRVSSGRMPLIIGGAALVLSGLGAGMFIMHRGATAAPAATMAVASQSSPQERSAASSSLPEPVQAQKGALTSEEAQTQLPLVAQAQPVAAVESISKAPHIAAAEDLPKAGQQEKNTANGNPLDHSSVRRQVIPNLKMNSPSVPNQNLANLGEGTAPVTEIASSETVGGVPPTGLLASAARISRQPAPPPSVPAPVAPVKVMRDAKLISSARPAYPVAARQSSVQGSIAVSATVDANGKVINVKALSGPMLLRQAALDSVKQWKYSPALIDGKPATSQVTVNVEFRLN